MSGGRGVLYGVLAALLALVARVDPVRSLSAD